VWCTGLGTILQFHQIVFEFDRDFVSSDFFSNVNVCKMPNVCKMESSSMTEENIPT